MPCRSLWIRLRRITSHKEPGADGPETAHEGA